MSYINIEGTIVGFLLDYSTLLLLFSVFDDFVIQPPLSWLVNY